MANVLKKIEKIIHHNPIVEELQQQGILSSPVKNREVIQSLLDRFIREQDLAPPSPTQAANRPTEMTSQESSPNNGKLPIPTTASNPHEDMTDAIEEFISELSSAYQLYGCPTHILEVNMVKVAKGLGLEMDFACLPTHTLMSVVRTRPDGTKKKTTLFFKTSAGLNMYKLQLVDELVRRISSYATKDPPKLAGPASLSLTKPLVGLSSIGGAADLLNSGKTSPAPRADSPEISSSLASKKSNQELITAKSEQIEIKMDESDPRNEEELKQAILDMAAYGPGFFTGKQAAEGSGSVTPGDQIVSPGTTSSVQPISRSSSTVPATDATPAAARTGQSLLGESKPGQSRSPGMSKKAMKKHRRHFLLDKRYEKTFTKIAVEDGVKRLNQIKKAKSLYPIWVQWLLTGVASAGCCGIFFGGNWVDTAFSFVLGLLVALLGEGNRNPNFTRVYEFIAAFVVALLTRVFNDTITPLCFQAVVISSIIWLLQGVTITLAIVELLTRKLVSGTVRLFYGIMMSAIMSFGLDMGTAVYANLSGKDQRTIESQTVCGPDRPLDQSFYALFFLMSSVSFNILIESHWRQLVPMTVVSGVATFVNIYTDAPLGSSASAVVSALSSGVSANIYSRLTGNPAIIGVLSGLLMLVPGSIAVRGFIQMFQNNFGAGLNLVATVLVVCLALAVGTFASSLLGIQDDFFYRRKKQQQQEATSSSPTLSRIPRSELIF